MAKNNDANKTPTNTPRARLWLQTTTTTVAIMTVLVDNGFCLKSRIDFQLNVPIDTMIITATSAAIGIRSIHWSRNTTIISKKLPAIKVDKRPRPPDLILITDCPIIAQPAIPPKSPAPILAMPWPLHSRFLSLPVSVKSSIIVAVISDSSKPTTASGTE